MTAKRSRDRSKVVRFLSQLVPSLEEIGTSKPVLAPVVGGWLFALGSAWSLWPFVTSVLPPEQVDAVAVLFWGSAVLAPLAILLKAGVLAVVGWAVLILTNSERSLRSLYSVMLYGEAILAAQGVFSAILLQLTANGPATSPEDLEAALGLVALVPDSMPVLQAMASAVTLSHVLWYAFLGVGLRRAANLGRLPAWGLATLFWLAILGFAAAGTAFL